MAERNVVVRLKAEVAGYKSAMEAAKTSTDRFAASVDKDGKKIDTAAGRMVRSAEVHSQAWSTAGTTMTAFGAAGVAGLALATNAAMDWESAWTGVLKTVNGTPEQLSALEDSLRDMALRMPASAVEIAGVAEAAGQLGIKVEDVAAFTETMVNLGETTNLSADEAATSLARMANIMGTAASDVDRMGATIVDLGNNAATTEAEIVGMATNLAAAGRQAGLSESDVLAFASTLSSVGVEAEAGGTAISKVFTAINDAVIDGGDSLELFAQVAGVSSADFRTAYERDAAGAIASFIEGMGSLAASGESTTQVFEDLELTDSRLKRAILSTGQAQGLLVDQLELANKAWESNTALVAEAEKRYDTTEAKVAMAKNAINDAAIEVGESLLPALAAGAEGVADLASAFASLPDPIQQTLTGLGAVASVASLGAGGFLLLFPRIMETRRAFSDLAAISPRAAAGVGKFAKGSGLMVGVFAGLSALAAAINAIPSATSKTTLGVAETTQALLEMADAGGALQGVFDFSDDVFGVTGGVNSLADAARRIGDPSLIDRMQDLGGTLRGVFGNGDTSRTRAIEQIDTIGQSLASLVQSGEAERAADQFEMLAEQWEAGGGKVDDLKALMPAYTDALADADNQQTLAADSASAMGDSLAGYAAQVEVATAATDEATEKALADWREMVAEADASFLSVGDAYQSAIDKNIELAQSTAEATEDAGDSWEDYYDGVTVTGAEYIAQLQAQVDAQTNWEENILAISERVRDGMSGNMRAAAEAMIDELLTLGPEGAAQVEMLRKMSDEEFDKVVRLWGEKGTEAVSELVNKVESYRQPEIDLTINFAQATTELERWLYLNSGKRIQIATGLGGSGGTTFSTGGPVRGPGTTTSDSIPAWLSDGEYVQKASAVDFWGTRAMDSMNRMDVAGLWAALEARGYRDGGGVNFTAPPTQVTVSPVIDTAAFSGAGAPVVNVFLDSREISAAVRTRDRSLA